jgi:SRSO17 transposase
VKRQYTGTAGKVENCQVGVFLTYFTHRGYTFLDRRLYLPKEWSTEGDRRRAAQVPDTVTFQTKPELAVAMLQHAWGQGVPMAWVTGDEVYGDAPVVRDTVARAGKQYVLAVSANTPVWRECVLRAAPAGEVPPWESVAAVVAAWSPRRWRRITVEEGEKGPRTYAWARERIVESRQGRPGPSGWLLARRSLADPSDLAYYVSNASPHTTLQTLATVASARWSIETTIKEGKGETGLDEYEVRYWHSWHRHITLSMMAHAWLAAMRQIANEQPPDPALAEVSVPEVRRLLEVALPLPPRSPELRLAWSRWRRARRQQARRSHYRRRDAIWPKTGIHRNRSP